MSIQESLSGISFQESRDYQLIRSVITDPAVYGWVSDDNCPPPEKFEVPESDDARYIVVRKRDSVIGLWAFLGCRSRSWDVHTVMLPPARGLVRRLAIMMAHWIWWNTDCQEVTTSVPSYNRLALVLAKQSGMKEVTVEKSTYLKHGTLHDLIRLSMARPEGV